MKGELQELIEITTNQLGLPSFALVEKDLYVTQVLHAINQVDNQDFSLVFIGGTCLTKAHKIVQRMSEDLDFKVVPKDPSRSLKTQAARDKLSRVREEILQQINASTGLSPKEGQINKGNNNRFTQILLDYDAFYPIHASLRPQIKIELTAQVMQLPPERKCVASLIYETLGQESGMSSQWMNCTSTNETAIEKWSALCRYASSVTNQVKEFDPSIVRHLYDLYCIEQINPISSDFEKMAPLILQGEIERIKGQNPLYNKDPISEVQKGLAHFSQDVIWQKSYDAFINSMVFQQNPPTFQETLETFKKLHERAINAVQRSEIFQHNKTISIETTKEGTEKIVSSSLQEKLLDYADAQKKQQQLLWAYYEARTTDDRGETIKAKETVAANFSKLNSKSVELYNDPEIKTLIKSLQHVESPNEAVSWDNVKAQLLNEQEAHQAISVLLPPIKRAGFQATQALSQHQSQHKGGGRKR